MKDDNWSQLHLPTNHISQQPQQNNIELVQIPMLSTPFTNIVRIQAYFQQNIKIQGNQEPQKVTKVQHGSGFLIGKSKVFTSAAILYSNQTKTQANYVLLYPQFSEEKGLRKDIKSKHFHVNEHFKFQNPQQKFTNNFAIIFTEQNLIQSSAWQPFEFDWTYDEDFQSKENVTIAGYRWKESQQVYEKVFKQFNPQSKQNGIFKTDIKLLRGQQGSPLIIRTKDKKQPNKIIYNIVGILTKTEQSTASAIEFGYLVEEKQILKKQTKTLGAEVLFSNHASKSYQDLRKQQESMKQDMKSSKISEVQKEAPNPSDDIRIMMESSIAEKTSKIHQLEYQMKIYKQQLAVMKNQKSALSVEAQEINELNIIILRLKDANQALSQKVCELMDKVEHLEIQERKVLHLTQRQNELKSQNQMLKAELISKNKELTLKTVSILTLEKSLVSQVKQKNQPKSQITASQCKQTSQKKNPHSSQIQEQRPPQPSTKTQQISVEYEYIMFAFDTVEQSKKRYYKNLQQKIKSVKTQTNINLSKQGYTFDHSKMLFNVELFVKYWWEHLELLDLSETGIDNMCWQDFAAFGYMMPKLKILILENNQVNKIQPKDLELFSQLRVLVLDSQKFTTVQKNAFKNYENQNGKTVKVIFK